MFGSTTASEGNEIPQLQRIIVSDGARAAMEPTLRGALEAVFADVPASEVSGGESSVGGDAPPGPRSHVVLRPEHHTNFRRASSRRLRRYGGGR